PSGFSVQRGRCIALVRWRCTQGDAEFEGEVAGLYRRRAFESDISTESADGSARPGRSPVNRAGAAKKGLAGADCCPLGRLLLRRLSEQFAQLVLGVPQRSQPSGREVLPGTVDIEGQHRHRRAQGWGLAAVAALGRALQRYRDLVRARLLEHAALEIERVA